MMSQIELSLFRNNEGREIEIQSGKWENTSRSEIEIIVDYDYQEYRHNTFGPDEEEGLIINSITNYEDEIILVTDYERSEIEQHILECVREPSQMIDNS